MFLSNSECIGIVAKFSEKLRSRFSTGFLLKSEICSWILSSMSVGHPWCDMVRIHSLQVVCIPYVSVVWIHHLSTLRVHLLRINSRYRSGHQSHHRFPATEIINTRQMHTLKLLMKKVALFCSRQLQDLVHTKPHICDRF